MVKQIEAKKEVIYVESESCQIHRIYESVDLRNQGRHVRNYVHNYNDQKHDADSFARFLLSTDFLGGS